MKLNNLVHVELGEMVRPVSGLDRDKVVNFGEAIDNDPYGIIPLAGFGKSDNEVHAYIVPFPLGYLEGLEESRWF